SRSTTPPRSTAGSPTPCGGTATAPPCCGSANASASPSPCPVSTPPSRPPSSPARRCWRPTGRGYLSRCRTPGEPDGDDLPGAKADRAVEGSHGGAGEALHHAGRHLVIRSPDGGRDQRRTGMEQADDEIALV